MIKIKTNWTATSTLDDDKSGVAVFEIPGQSHSIKFEDFNDYYFVIKAMSENAKLVKEEALNNLKHKISLLIDVG